MRTSRAISLLGSGLLVVLAGASGCGATNPDAGTARKAPYAGPTDPLAKVAADIDANNQQLPTIWASHYYEATIVDPTTKKSSFVNGTGALLYRRPLGFRLVGKKDVVGDVFEVGSTADHYWLKLVPDRDTLWFGEHKYAGRPCVQQIPIQPNLVLEVLGVGLVGTDLMAAPAPVMRFNPDADAYMMVWVSPAGGPAAGGGGGGTVGTGPARLAAQREVWYDRATKLPKLVVLFDPDGRPVLRANLDKHKPVEVAGVPADRWPRLATEYKLYFPDTGSKMAFTLDEVALDRKGVPSRRGIVFPGATPDEAGVREVVKLDKNCTDSNRAADPSRAE
ncbi:MAG: hypothetical protein JWO31_3441 [Phycisphaerales bacterium]|nr:hypothetical protein [Phycisphaerales bacterium]